MFGAEKGKADRLDGHGLCIGIVQARFNESITNALAQESTSLGLRWLGRGIFRRRSARRVKSSLCPCMPN